MTTYKALSSVMILRVSDDGVQTFIPPAADNKSYTDYLEWLAAGNTPEPYVAPPPQTVSRFQARAALLNAGLLDDVETLMADAATPALARLAWTDAIEFRRTSPTVLAMASALGLTEAQIDALFVDAAGIEA